MDKEEQTLYYYVVALKNLHLDHDPEFSTAKDGLSLFRSYIMLPGYSVDQISNTRGSSAWCLVCVPASIVIYEVCSILTIL